VLGVDGQGAEVFRLALAHGDDPIMLLGRHGWQAGAVSDVARHPVDTHVLTVTFRVEPLVAGGGAVAGRQGAFEPREPGRDDDLVTLEGEVARRHQRVAAYAVVTSSRGVLMTQFSDRTNAPGQWGLPGGGLEVGEAPDLAVLREVWEESGQVIESGELALITTSHWLGRAPAGQLEDFHAVRVIYRAACPEPTEPVVHDVGGTTASAAWVPPADLDLLALTTGWRSILHELAVLGDKAARSGVVTPPDEADGPDGHHHEAQPDDGARPQS
jgi:8-oxo-dGTP diphosphatase